MSTTPDEPLALVHRGWDHLKLQRPLAAWACWQRALRLDPGNAAAEQALDLLASSPELPAAARVPYRFRTPVVEATRARWDASFRGRDMADLATAAAVFADLASSGDDPDARYNEALCHAWLGENVRAIAALDSFVRHVAATDTDAAADAWCLAEVLRHGAGAETLADDFKHSLMIPWSDADGDPTILDPDRIRALPAPIDPTTGRPLAGASAFEWLDRPMPPAEAVRNAGDLPRVLATVVRTPDSLRLSTPRLSTPNGFTLPQLWEKLTRFREGWDQRQERTPLPLAFLDAAIWTFRLPAGLDAEAQAILRREAVEDFYENRWILAGGGRSLSDGPPDYEFVCPLAASGRAAAGDAIARARLVGLIRFREQLAARPSTAALYAGYPFDRLRHRLGLDVNDPAAVDPADPTCMSGAELKRLDPAALDDSALLDAFRSALAIGLIDDHGSSVAARFASALVERAPDALTRTGDPLAATLVGEAFRRGDLPAARSWADRSGDGKLRGSVESLYADPEILKGCFSLRLRLHQESLTVREVVDVAEHLLQAGLPGHARALATLALDEPHRDADANARAEALLDQLSTEDRS